MMSYSVLNRLKTAMLCASCIVMLSFTSNAQSKMGSERNGLEDEIPFYYKNGVKLSVENNTPLLLANLNDKVVGNSSEEMAMDWLAKNQNLLGIKDLNDLQVGFKRSGRAGDVIRFKQFSNDIQVYNSEIVVNVLNGIVKYVTNTYNPSVQSISSSMAFTKDAALAIAREHIGAKGAAAFTETELFVYHVEGVSKLVYRVVIEGDQPSGSWHTFVDALSGEVLRSSDLTCYHKHPQAPLPLPDPPINGSGNVFDPDPLSVAGATYGDVGMTDNSDANSAQLQAAMSNVTLYGIEFASGVYKLKGPYAEIVDTESPYNGLFTQASSTFNFTRDQDGFEAVNCYHHVDKSMRYINVTLGTTLMPFQYVGGVKFDPSGLNGADNSHYLGGSGVIAFGEGGVDDAEDADVIIHELGHGLHDWLTGGNLSQVNGLSEGSGDYWAQSYSRAYSGQWTSSDAAYHYMFHWDGHNPFWGGRTTNYGATYPGGLTGSIHTDGQIWATALMRIYNAIGNQATDLAFLEGLALTGSSSSQNDAANAVYQAAINMGYSCEELTIIRDEFLATGYTVADQRTHEWTGATTSDWNTGSNWCAGTVPTSSDDVIIASAPSTQPQITMLPATSATCATLEIESGATLTVDAGSYAPSPNDEIVLINVAAIDAIQGTFTGWTEGSTVVINDEQYIVSYLGGDGNDLVLSYFGGACDVPTDVSVSDITDTDATFNWTGGVAGADRYQMRWRPVGGSDWYARNTFDESGTRYIQAFEPGTEYEWIIRTRCGAGNGDSSQFVSGPNFTTLDGCGPVQASTFINMRPTRVDAMWSAHTGATQYKLRYRPVGEPVWSTKTVDGSATTQRLRNLIPGTLYEYRLKVECDNGLSGISGFENFTTPTDLAARLANPNDSEMEFQVYPNPTSGHLKINFGDEIGTGTITVINTLGQQVYSQSISNTDKAELNLNLTSGLYFLEINFDGNRSSERIVIE